MTGSPRSSTGSSRLAGRSPKEIARLAWRKAIHRKVSMGRFGVPTAESRSPSRPCPLTIELWGPDRYHDVLGTNPYLTAEDLEHFDAQRSTCIVVLEDGRIVASSWMTSGRVFVHELQRSLDVPPNEHVSCRSYVDDDHHGMALMSHMIHTYSAEQDEGDEVWGLVYEWNTASMQSLGRIGWMRSGDYWTSWWFGVRFGGQRRYPPRPMTP